MPKDLNDLTSDEVKTFRKEMELTQAGLALKLGITPQAVEKWEKLGAPGAWRYAFSSLRHGMKPYKTNSEQLEMLEQGIPWEYAFNFSGNSHSSDVQQIKKLATEQDAILFMEGHPDEFPGEIFVFTTWRPEQIWQVNRAEGLATIKKGRPYKYVLPSMVALSTGEGQRGQRDVVFYLFRDSDGQSGIYCRHKLIEHSPPLD